MKTRKCFFFAGISVMWLHSSFAQNCVTTDELNALPGKFLSAAQYPWPAARAEYFINMKTAVDKASAKKTLEEIEKIEGKVHTSFNLTGGNWESLYTSTGYGYEGNTRLGKYYFQAALHEFLCLRGKLSRNSEYNTVLRIYVNSIPLNTLDRFLRNPFGSSIGEYDFGLQFMDWKNHKPADVNAQLISLFTYMTCNSNQLIEKINSGDGYFQDIPEKDIKPNSRRDFVYRYWFIKKSNQPLLIPVSRKEYLQSLLEYYEREKLYFPKLMTELKGSSSVKQYSSWEADLADKIAVVKKVLQEQNQEWLSQQAVINRIEDASQTYKAGLKERTNYNRLWKFYDNEKKAEPLYKYNSAYFKTIAGNAAAPQLMTVAFRYVSMPLSLRVMNNFSKNFDFAALKKMIE